MFKRRKKQDFWSWSKAQVWPRGGLWRAVKYQWHRLRRLPDPPHRVARGVFAGTFVNFPPIFGFQIPAAAILAWAMRGNILAAVILTLLSNPVTTPIIAIVSLKTGHWILGTTDTLTVNGVFAAFGYAAGDLWNNLMALFGPGEPHWDGLILFWKVVWLPYLVGSIGPGLLVSGLVAWVSLPLVRAYQAMRKRRLKARSAKRSDDGAPAP